MAGGEFYPSWYYDPFQYYRPHYWTYTYPTTTTYTVSGKREEKSLKASEVIASRGKLVDWFINEPEADLELAEAEALVDFLLHNDYLSDKFYKEALNNKEDK